MLRPMGLAVIAAMALTGAANLPRGVAPVVGDSLELFVASTTDMHGWMRGWDYFANRPDTTRGLSRVVTIVDSLRRAQPDRVIFVDAGDNLQGAPLATVAVRDSALPNPIIAAMNAARYDAAAIGNHEFNHGLPYLRRAIEQASFPLLAANAYAPDGRHAFAAWRMLTRGGIRVAIVGATTPGSMIWDRDKLAGRVDVRDIAPSVRNAVAEARRQGAVVVVVVMHSGLAESSSYDTVATGLPSENVAARVAREVPGIDVVVFGHTHRELADSVIGSTLLTQPRNWAASVSIARLVLTRPSPGGPWTVVSRGARIVHARGHTEDSAIVAVTQSAHERTVAYVTAPLGATPLAWRADSARVMDTPIADFVLEVERRTAGADLASGAVFSLNADFGPGAITMADIAELYPYDNNVLRAVRISGRQLRDYLEFSARYFRAADQHPDDMIDPSVPGFNFDIVQGVDYTIDISRPIGSRITNLSRGGRPVVDTDTFTMALNDYRQSGGGGYAMLRGAPVVYDQQQVIRQLLVDEVRRKGILRPEDYFKPNWRLAPDSLVGPTYRSMRRLPFDRPRTP
ncbi:MAG TPA: 5'-nucleotidase C-terminal domain-containing protein [Gemmatimonadaceae bacterium]|nr:5'-nucleotidase C-terminal domain-containing protein [Gemmatimonadaceae bacterium]